jgi:starch synthase (maltosyl-transferring)
VHPISHPAKDAKRLARAAAKAPRLVIEAIKPCVDGGRFVAKRSVGERLVVEADIFGEGHDRLAAAMRWRAPDDDRWQEVAMQALGNDRWRAEVLLPRTGRYELQVQAWIDVFGAYRDELGKKAAAGQPVLLELQEGVLLLNAALARASQTNEVVDQPLIDGLKHTLKQLAAKRDQAAQVALLLGDDVLAWMVSVDERAFSVHSAPVLQVDAERRAAGFASWYELFPRSMGLDALTHGTFDDVTARLPAIRAMGFDTLYFPPIHPIGRQHRKGPNNTLVAGPDDPGSPYAIGSAEGGHDAIHAELGTLEDFRALRLAALDHGLELAIDFAIQCSPDHPWLKEHPDWFSWRPDGTIRYAENPPKKYQDIVNVDFYAPGAVPGLWMALRDVVLFWAKEGIKVFRVDNPHTKPMPFWEWLIGDVRGRFPDVIFLAEAFTRPKPMYQLAKLGFSQSYTYFTWRHTKQEFIDYLTELADGPPRDFFRPHFFVNTPDINPYFLQRSGRAGFVIRAALAATLSGLWGVYSGFELCESQPVPGGKEEYADSEKYQLRQRDWLQPGNIVREITLLNHARQTNPALQTHTGVRFCRSSGDQILCFTKTATAASGEARNIVFVAICLDPHAAQACSVELPLEDWGLTEDAAIVCEDLVHGHTQTLYGRHHTLHLDPAMLAFTLWRLRPEGDS